MDLSTFELLLLKLKPANSAPTSPNAELDLSDVLSPAKGNTIPNFASRNAANCIVTTKPIDAAHPYCLEFSFYPATQGPVKKPTASLSSSSKSSTVTTWTLSLESKAKMEELINAVRQLQSSKSKCIDKYTAFRAEAQAMVLNSWQKSRGSDDQIPKSLTRAQQGSRQNLVGRKLQNFTSANHSDTPNRSWQVKDRPSSAPYIA